jgi:hypothetical protein
MSISPWNINELHSARRRRTANTLTAALLQRSMASANREVSSYRLLCRVEFEFGRDTRAGQRDLHRPGTDSNLREILKILEKIER